MRRTVGVIGGMGPAATVDFMAKVLARTPVEAEHDHIRMIVDCNPHAPNRHDAVRGEGTSPGPVIGAMARGLENAGAEFIVMACNTAHVWQADIEAATTVPFVSLIDETAAALKGAYPHVRRAGVLAADGCLEAGLYQDALKAEGIEPVLLEPEAQARLMALIYAIKGGDVGERSRGAMAAFAAELVDQGAQAIIAGCTEIPLVMDQRDVAVPLVDSTDVLVTRTIALGTGEARLPSR